MCTWFFWCCSQHGPRWKYSFLKILKNRVSWFPIVLVGKKSLNWKIHLNPLEPLSEGFGYRGTDSGRMYMSTYFSFSHNVIFGAIMNTLPFSSTLCFMKNAWSQADNSLFSVCCRHRSIFCQQYFKAHSAYCMWHGFGRCTKRGSRA